MASTDGVPIEDYALRVADKWGGGSRARDDGVLFVLAVRDQRMRLEVGYGMEPALPDARTRSILENAAPSLRNREYAAAVTRVVVAVCEATRQVEPARAGPEAAPRDGLLATLYASGALAFLLGVLFGATWLAFRVLLQSQGGAGGRGRALAWLTSRDTTRVLAALSWLVVPTVVALGFEGGVGAYGPQHAGLYLFGTVQGLAGAVAFHRVLRKWLIAPGLAVGAAAFMAWLILRGADAWVPWPVAIMPDVVLHFILLQVGSSRGLGGKASTYVSVGGVTCSSSPSYSSSLSHSSSPSHSSSLSHSSSPSHSSSSSYSGSSSHASGSSYTGGGGSFGGGGASASW